MKLQLAWVTPRPGRSKDPEFSILFDRYLKRIRAYNDAETLEVATEAQLLDRWTRMKGRTSPALFLMDERGDSCSSEQLAERLRICRHGSLQHAIFAIGPPNGWTAEARANATGVVSLGPMTLPHELARVILAEQIYRALTILAGHPYHLGH